MAQDSRSIHESMAGDRECLSGLAKERSPTCLQVLCTTKGDAPWVRKIANSVQLLLAVRFRAGCEGLKDISKPLSLVMRLPRYNSTEASA